MSIEEKSSIVFIPLPTRSHLVSAVKTAELLSDRDERLAVTVLIMNMPIIDTSITPYINNSPHSRTTFVHLQENKSVVTTSPGNPIHRLMESHKDSARDAVAEIIKTQKSNKISGFIVDMFCTAMIDVANEFGAPSYIFVTCGAASLGLMLHLQTLNDDHNLDLSMYEDSDAVVSVPTYVHPVPARVWPSCVFDNEKTSFLDFVRRFRETKGIIINTFLEFEHHAITALSFDDRIPPVYPIGPLLQDEREEHKQHDGILRWLDEQPESSVVYLCFGMRGCFESDQVKQIAVALENSGYRFLWSLRKAPSNPNEVLPEGFLDRTMGVGKVIGWAPQMAVLSHPAVGAFVSHCGWNSTLESVWCGVPMAVWPLYAEQKANAFQFVKELGIGVEIEIEYRRESGVIVGAETIEKAIRKLMDPGNEIRVKMKGVKEKSRKALVKGESSYNFLSCLIDKFVDKE